MLGWIQTSRRLVVGLALALAGASVSPSDAELEGRLIVSVMDDFERQSSRTLFEMLPDGASSRIQLVSDKLPSMELRTGDRIRVRGRGVGSGRFEAEEIILMAPMEGSGGAGGGKGGKGGRTSTPGTRTVAVILINLTDSASILDRAGAEQMMWGSTYSANELYLASSRGVTSFMRDGNQDGQIDLFGPYDVPEAGLGSCSYGSWGQQARDLAIAEGQDLSGFDHFVYVLPEVTSCQFGGVAVLNGSEVWLNYRHVFALAHELGHNFGMNHAGDDPDNDGIVDWAYGDSGCLMGAGYRTVFLNAPHSDQLRYIDSASIVGISGSTGTHRFTLRPLAVDPSAEPGTRIVKISKQDNGDFYYLSFRDATSFDADLSPAYREGVSIHRYAGSGSTLTALLGTLSDGESFVDDINGVTVTQLGRSVDSSSVDIEVVLTPTCGASGPNVALESLSGDLQHNNTISPAEMSVYKVTVKNNDASDCPASELGLSVRNLPSAMTPTFDRGSVFLGPGETTVVSLEVAPNGSPDGSYVFYVSLADVDGVAPPHARDEDFARLTLDATSVTPQAPTGLSGYFYTSKGQLKLVLEWSPSASEEVVRYHLYQDDTPLPEHIASNTGTRLALSWTEGTYTFWVAAESASGKLSPLSDPYTITLSKKGG